VHTCGRGSLQVKLSGRGADSVAVSPPEVPSVAQATATRGIQTIAKALIVEEKYTRPEELERAQG
jgi:hypothetical protein